MNQKVGLTLNWQALQNQVSQLLPEPTQRLMKSLKYVNEPQPIQPALVTDLFGTDLKASVSRLQSYARNPYEFFLQYGLRLRDREVMDLTPAEKGTYMHALFEGVFNALIQEIRFWDN
ncbi:ATP-dependent helicase/deoxyribonuclease subunit B [Weissella viridescens]|uniref:ATP-dependent helicase/deoxyribonuclease subunit B n=1 Tax=Weissella viridescens TaxID=1629 RepID=A0A380P7N4_WEIVI|nr:ATP-dependent helicase/deoxyribonuclease subunit B [Weissella viridescens]